MDNFKVLVCNPEHSLVYHDNDRLLRAKSTSDICTIISQRQYLNWQHFDLLEEIIEEYGDSALEQELESYCKEIELFEEETDLNDVRNIIFTPLPPNSYLMKVPIPEGETPTMGTVRRVKNGLKKMNGVSLPVHHVGKNSPFGIYFIVPRLFFPPAFMTELSVSVSESDEVEGCPIIKISEKFVRQLLNLPTTSTNHPSHSDNVDYAPPCPADECILQRHVSVEVTGVSRQGMNLIFIGVYCIHPNDNHSHMSSIAMSMINCGIFLIENGGATTTTTQGQRTTPATGATDLSHHQACIHDL